jgi:hypothetical protein
MRGIQSKNTFVFFSSNYTQNKGLHHKAQGNFFGLLSLKSKQIQIIHSRPIYLCGNQNTYQTMQHSKYASDKRANLSQEDFHCVLKVTLPPFDWPFCPKTYVCILSICELLETWFPV